MLGAVARADEGPKVALEGVRSLVAALEAFRDDAAVLEQASPRPFA